MADKKTPEDEPQNDDEPPQDDQSTICEWCQKPVASKDLAKGAVCLRCYKLLVNARISEKEIFSKPPPGKRE